MPAARLRIPGLRFDPVLASVHVLSPVADRQNTIDGWRNEMTGAKAQLDNCQWTSETARGRTWELPVGGQ